MDTAQAQQITTAASRIRNESRVALLAGERTQRQHDVIVNHAHRAVDLAAKRDGFAAAARLEDARLAHHLATT